MSVRHSSIFRLKLIVSETTAKRMKSLEDENCVDYRDFPLQFMHYARLGVGKKRLKSVAVRRNLEVYGQKEETKAKIR